MSSNASFIAHSSWALNSSSRGVKQFIFEGTVRHAVWNSRKYWVTIYIEYWVIIKGYFMAFGEQSTLLPNALYEGLFNIFDCLYHVTNCSLEIELFHPTWRTVSCAGWMRGKRGVTVHGAIVVFKPIRPFKRLFWRYYPEKSISVTIYFLS